MVSFFCVPTWLLFFAWLLRILLLLHPSRLMWLYWAHFDSIKSTSTYLTKFQSLHYIFALTSMQRSLCLPWEIYSAVRYVCVCVNGWFGIFENTVGWLRSSLCSHTTFFFIEQKHLNGFWIRDASRVKSESGDNVNVVDPMRHSCML